MQEKQVSEGNQEFSLGQGKFEICIRSKWWSAGNISQEFMGEFWVGDINMGVFRVYKCFKAIRIN